MPICIVILFSTCKQSIILINDEGSGVLVNDENCHANSINADDISEDIMDGEDELDDEDR